MAEVQCSAVLGWSGLGRAAYYVPSYLGWLGHVPPERVPPVVPVPKVYAATSYGGIGRQSREQVTVRG